MLSGKNPLLIALALGLLAGLIAYSAIKTKERQVKAGWETVKILCAAVDIPEGSELDHDMVAVREIPEKFVTEEPEDWLKRAAIMVQRIRDRVRVIWQVVPTEAAWLQDVRGR